MSVTALGESGPGIDQEYLGKQTLRTGTAGWVLLAGLGVGYVISGDYSGWNFGLAEGGFGGLAVATVVIAAMYGAMVLSMAEMSAALPTAGGGYTFARRALGPWGGFATGTAVLIEYSIAPAAIATFIGAYVESLGLFGITDGWWVYLVVYTIFVGIHLAGVGEALKAMFVITAIALVGLGIFAVASIGSFSVSNLTDIAPTRMPREPASSCPSPSGSSSPSRVSRSRQRKRGIPRATCHEASSRR
jgi:ethanolamine permease